MTVVQPPRLVAITDLSELDPVTLLARLRRLAESARPGSVALLLRDHAATGKQRLGLGRELRALARDSGQSLWIADRIDLALLLEADGLHLGEASVPAAQARRLWPHGRHLSRAWHATQTQPFIELADVDALLVSPVLAERKGRPALGLDALPVLRRALAQQGSSPSLYALGGVTSHNAAACVAAGAAGVAAIGAVLGPDAAALLSALDVAR